MAKISFYDFLRREDVNEGNYLYTRDSNNYGGTGRKTKAGRMSIRRKEDQWGTMDNED